MKEPKQEIEIRRYLLGELSDSEREEVEQRFFTDGDYKEEVLMVEEELLEDYVAGVLIPQERELFHKNYLSAPLQKRKLRLAQALERRAAQASVPTPKTVGRPSWLERLLNVFRFSNGLMQLSWAMLVLIIVLAGAWLIVKTLRTDRNEIQAELIRLNGPQSTVLAPGSTVASGVLSPISVREGGRSPLITITGDTQVVQLRIPQPSGQQGSYQAILKDNKGGEVARISDIAVHSVDNGPTIVLQFPAKIFEPGDYVVTLAQLNSGSGGEGVGDYSFRIAR
jgi:anti-sigma factor RsiW